MRKIPPKEIGKFGKTLYVISWVVPSLGILGWTLPIGVGFIPKEGFRRIE